MVKSPTVRAHRRHANAKVDPVIAVTLYQEGKSLRAIARELGVSRMAVARAIHYANISSPAKNPTASS
jgi:DNA-binding CsgD family transcriptional regulator